MSSTDSPEPSRFATPSTTLRELVRAYRQAKNETKRHPPDRREHRVHAQLQQELHQRFEAVLDRWVDDDKLRAQWRADLDAKAELPPEGPDFPVPLLFKGISETGSSAEVIPAPDGALQLVQEGKPTLRVPSGTAFGERPLEVLEVAGQRYREVFEAAPSALDRLVAYADDPDTGAPWDHLRELYADGLVDPEFGLTHRGRRLVAARREEAPAKARVVL